MTANFEEFVDDPSQYAHDSLMRRVHLLQTLEGFAQAYSDDYAEGLEDACRAGKGVDDLLGTLETDVAFEAKRLRTIALSETHSGVQESLSYEYTISSSVKRSKLLLETVPKFLIDLAIELGDYEEDDFQKPDLELGLGFTQTFTVKSEGASFEREYSLDFHIGNDMIELTDELLEDIYIADAEIDKPAEPTEMDDIFSTIFSAEETAVFKESADEALHDHDAAIALGQLLRQMPDIRRASTTSQYELAERVVVQMFTDPN